MLATLRREYAQLVTSGAQLLLLFVGFRLDSRTGWLVSLSLMALISVFAWRSALRRVRAIRDTPTSKVASAAQGYVELVGRGRPFGDVPLLSKFTQLPCLWYRYTVEERSARDQWRTVERGESSDSFLLRDGSGECIVDPEQAEIITRHRDRWVKDNERYTEWKLIDQDSLYVIGAFRTKNCVAEFNSRAELNALLAEWKKDMPALHARFDLNKDNVLDMNEWLLARQAAAAEVATRKREAAAQPDIHIISQPQDGRLFLISNLTPDRLARRYLIWTWVHLAIFFGALGGLGWALEATIG